jgi:hypothetical protein
MERLLEQAGIHSGNRSLINAVTEVWRAPSARQIHKLVHYGACRHVTICKVRPRAVSASYADMRKVWGQDVVGADRA